MTSSNQNEERNDAIHAVKQRADLLQIPLWGYNHLAARESSNVGGHALHAQLGSQ